MKHGGNLEAAARSYGRAVTDFTDFSANLNPLGPPPEVFRVLRSSLGQIAQYPDPEMTALRETLGCHFGLDPEEIVPGNGAASLLHHFLQFRRPRSVLLPVPAFGEYPRALRASGTPYQPWPLAATDDFYPLAGELKNHLARHDLLLLAQPNNPTGVLWPRTELLEALPALRMAGGGILLDESFLPFVPGWEALSLLGEVRHGAYVLLSLTKILALPGLRLGFLALPREEAQAFRAYLPPWEVNALAAAVTPVALGAAEHWRRTQELVVRERAFLRKGLTSLGYRVYPAAANFLLVEGPAPSAGPLADALGREGFLIRISLPDLPHRFFRLAVRRRGENRRLLEALGKIQRRD